MCYFGISNGVLGIFSIFFVVSNMAYDKKYWILTHQISISLTAKPSLTEIWTDNSCVSYTHSCLSVHMNVFSHESIPLQDQNRLQYLHLYHGAQFHFLIILFLLLTDISPFLRQPPPPPRSPQRNDGWCQAGPSTM